MDEAETQEVTLAPEMSVTTTAEEAVVEIEETKAEVALVVADRFLVEVDSAEVGPSSEAALRSCALHAP